MLFRPQRGSFADAMGEVVEVNTMEELIGIIKKSLYPYQHNLIIDKNTVKIEYYTYDDRIAWDTYIVRLENYGVLGFTNGPVV